VFVVEKVDSNLPTASLIPDAELIVSVPETPIPEVLAPSPPPLVQALKISPQLIKL
jgi:hypothetical protein